jgi:hypothetical protein
VKLANADKALQIGTVPKIRTTRHQTQDGTTQFNGFNFDPRRRSERETI